MATLPAEWTNQDIVLYHGTVLQFVKEIEAGVRVALGKPRRDFGPGFYTTTRRIQAYAWATRIAASKSAEPAVIQITVARDALADLEAMSFVGGDLEADDYWSLVRHCRGGALSHGRVGRQQNYDVIYGPLSANWRYRLSFASADQVSFHTEHAEAVLNRSARERII